MSKLNERRGNDSTSGDVHDCGDSPPDGTGELSGGDGHLGGRFLSVRRRNVMALLIKKSTVSKHSSS